MWSQRGSATTLLCGFSQSGCDKVAACCKDLWYITDVAFVIAAVKGKRTGGRGKAGGLALEPHQ